MRTPSPAFTRRTLLRVHLPVLPLTLAAARKPIRFVGRVEGLDPRLCTVAVRHDDIPGFRPAMTMDYPVETKAQLRLLSPGDEIEATVYVGDPTLHNVRIIAHRAPQR